MFPNGIRKGIVTGGSADNDDWYGTLSPAFPRGYEPTVIVAPFSNAGRCPTGFYVASITSSSFRIYCKGTAPYAGFSFIAF